MALQSLIYLKPDSDSAFETFCLKVFRTSLKLPNLQKFARTGHRQFGVDLVSSASSRIVGIQCKLKNTAAGLTVGEIDTEVERAKTFAPSLTEYIIATTADREPVLQQHALRITQRHDAAGLFSVTISAWQDIEEILKQDFDLATELYGIPTRSVSTLNVASQATITVQAPSGGAHAEIDEAAQHLTNEEPDVALALLQRLKRDRWEFLTPREKFRVLANIGNAFLQRKEQDKAAITFLDAATHQPGDADAFSIAAQGHLLSGNLEEAYRAASESCSLNPYNERGRRIRILSAPKGMSSKELIEMVPDVLRSNINIAVSLYERAIEKGEPVEAERVLRLAKGDSLVLQFSLGVALLQQGLPAGIQESLLSLARDPGKLREAREHFSTVIDSPDAPPGMIAAACHNRGLASALLNDEDQALADFRSAYEREPSNESFSIAFMREALQRGEDRSALNAAREISRKNPSPLARFMASIALYDSGGEDDKRKALALLQEGLADLGTAEPEIRLDYIGRTLYLLHVSGALTESIAKELLEKLSDPLERGVIKSWALLRMGRQGEAETVAKQTASLLNETTNIVAKRGVAFLLCRLGLAEKALPIWLEVCPPLGFTEDTLPLLQVADDLGADEVILDYCEKLRSNGVYASEIAGREIELLTDYNELRKARAAIREYLEANPTNLSLRLVLLHIAVIKGWTGIVETYMTSVPSPQEIQTAADGARLVQILSFKGMVQTGVEIAYELVRRFPDDPNSHRVLITSVLGLGGSNRGDLKLDAPTEVQVGSAVRIYRTGQETSEWIVIEDSEKPEISRDEYPPNHPLAKALIGKKKEERVAFPGFAGEQTAVVEEIKNKILFRMHDSMEKMDRRFPEHSFFRAVPIKIAEDGSTAGNELDALIELQKKITTGPREAGRFYDERRFPAALFAKFAHIEIRWL